MKKEFRDLGLLGVLGLVRSLTSLRTRYYCLLVVRSKVNWAVASESDSNGVRGAELLIFASVHALMVQSCVPILLKEIYMQ